MAEPVAKKRRISPSHQTNGAVPGFAKWDLEQDYEQRLRSRKKDTKREKLMVKTSEGKITVNPRMEEEDVDTQAIGDDDSLLASGDDEGDSAVADLEPKRPIARKPVLPRKEQIRQAKEDLARIAGLLNESPEENIGLLSTLAEISNSEEVAVRKIALAAQSAIYISIIPGYRIRPLSKDDLNAKVSKDVRKLRSFEQGLLAGYKDYVNTLSKLAANRGRSGKDQATDASLAGVAISCICTLLTSVPHFNCRNDLVESIVLKLSSRRLDPDFIKARDALEKLFQEDEDGHSSLEAVSQLTKTMKTKNWAVHESVVNTFLHLRLLTEFNHKASTRSIDKDDDDDRPVDKKGKQKREFRTKRERKNLRERKQVATEMKEADAIVSYEDRDKNQAETLKLVFIAYFRILKDRVQHLMGAVLEGLARYSHLINQDFFGDILEALKDLINEAESLQESFNEEDFEDDEKDTVQRNATRESLLCIITAFALLNGQQDVIKSANSLSLDLSFFISHLYRTLIPLAVDTELELSARVAHLADPNGLVVPTARDTKVNVSTTAVLLLRSLQSVLQPASGTKFVPPVRLAAFLKQLHTLALHVPQKSATAILELIKQVTKSQGAKVAALWHTEERKGDGVFDARSQEIESSNPFASTIWETELLRLHFDPNIRESLAETVKNVRTSSN
ncbi:nucleolar complex-associated protein 3 [Dissoconium aciculare CBS 342.82]|uniref:Nucleolar complex-associated protein 3 n=1 Tax=Dissoconium aciculare CBS 342.82 TaxID=1314786 RepID=A0A6J3LRY9_9PEZI|nr:nucleolar complex-associated protein 3 [Dissoconium aciculare CBS 342.82]KAF1818388.1 nucleolar complex-associated protein 3 [Dissoconium aciculare CBS 342.82]